MKKVLSTLFFLTAVFLAAVESPPVIRYGFSEPQNGKIPDLLGNAVFETGRSASIGTAFGGAKSVVFDGTGASVSKLDISKVADRLDGFDFTISFQIFFKELKPGLNTGLGLVTRGDGLFMMNFRHVGPHSFSIQSSKPLKEGKWHYVAMSYSREHRNAKLYLDGELVTELRNADLFPLKLSFDSIGAFNGAIASLNMWDAALREEELTDTAPDPDTYDKMIGLLQNAKTTQVQLDTLRQSVLKQLNILKTRRKVSISELDRITRLASVVLRLFDGTAGYHHTTLENAPFALLEVKLCSKIIRTPDKFPEDGVFTTELHIGAAKGERTSSSFVLSPYAEVAKLELLPGDFKSEKGAVLPASILDRKVVKCWYQPNWNSYWNSGTYILVPDLLLNDETLVKVDTVKQKNYLRIEYPSGTKYCDINEKGNKEDGTAKNFNYLTEPVRDAPTFQSVSLTPGENKQFVLTVRVPKDAKAGLYRSQVRVVADGKDAGSFTIALRVYPFELPRAMTQYDLNEPFITYMTGAVDYELALEMTRDPKEAERITRENLRNMKDYQILYPSPSEVKMDSVDLQLRKEEGFDMKPFFCAGNGQNVLPLGMSERGGKSLEEFCTPEKMQSLLEPFEKGVVMRMNAVEKYFGHRDVYFYGSDEAASADGLAIQLPFRKILYKHGGKLMTSGWRNNFYLFPSYENLHSEAALIDKSIADRWHAIKCKLTSYAAPFAGPDNPELMRRTHGMEMYRANYDGWFMLRYCAGVNIWNDRVNGRYRNFMCVYVTKNGPINTLAFTGLGEGQEDIRFMTLLRQTAEECHKSGNPEAIVAAKKAVAWLECVDASVADLDLTRLEAADYIITMMKTLGKEVGE